MPGSIGAVSPTSTISPIQTASSPSEPSLIQRIKNILKRIFFAIFPGAHRLFQDTKKAKPLQHNISKQYKVTSHQSPTATETTQKPRPYLILSIDGGGMRGVIPAAILVTIEKLVGGQIGKIFDCIAGTSTGGILAGGFTTLDPDNGNKSPRTALEVLKNYKDLGKKIFYRSDWYSVKTVGGWTGPKYDSSHKTTVLKELFKDKTLQDCITDDVIITSVDINKDSDDSVVLFRKNSENSQHKLSDVIDATTAAPSFFSSVGLDNRNLIDGGIALVNPAEMAALTALEREDLKERDIFVLSLGTGHYPSSPIKPEISANWGALQWADPIVHRMIDTSSHVVDHQLKLLEKEKRISYIRIQVELENGSQSAMDNTDPNNLNALENLANKTFNHFLEHGGKESLVDFLKQNRANPITP